MANIVSRTSAKKETNQMGNIFPSLTFLTNFKGFLNNMFYKFEVLMTWKLSWGLSFLLFGVSDGHIFFDFSDYCPFLKDTALYFREAILLV